MNEEIDEQFDVIRIEFVGAIPTAVRVGMRKHNSVFNPTAVAGQMRIMCATALEQCL